MGAGRHRGPSGVDRISALPDELLISILTCLRSTRAAARTSILSRRWRHVWKDLREISFSDHGQPRASVLDAIDAALSASAAAPLDRLDIDVTRDAAARSDDSRHVPCRARVAGWLHLAARRRRLAGELHLSVASRSCRRERESFEIRREREGREEDRNLPLELPVLEEATAIHIYISTSGMRPSIAAAGTFAALRVLAISSNSFDELDMEPVVSTQCPRLQELKLKGLGRRSCIPGVLSIRSSSLERLELGVEVLGKLTIDAPELVRLVASGCLHDRNSQSTAHIIVAPKLAELIWHHAYDSRYHQIIVGSGCHLQRLKVKPFYGYVSFWKLTERVVPTAALFQRFDTLDELHLGDV